jgi:hypothetical protein
MEKTMKAMYGLLAIMMTYGCGISKTPECTSYKETVCDCEGTGAMGIAAAEVACETAKSAEESAAKYLEDDDEDRFDISEDSCSTLEAAFTAASGCDAFDMETDADADGDADADCVDTNDGATDEDAVGCEDYWVEDCGEYDDSDFDSMAMCCVCGGGSTAGE